MRLALKLFTVLFTLLTVPSFAQAAECEDLAKAAVAVAMNGKVDAKLMSVEQLNIENQASGSVERVERLVFSTSASEITVDTLPSYYAQGQCELKNVTVVRE